MALDPKAALALIQEKQKAAAERDQTEQVTIAQIKDKLIKIEQLVKQGNQIDKNQEAKREELYRLTADLKTVIPKQTAFMDQVTMNAARIEDFLEVSFARVFTGLSSITNGMGVITNTIRTGFVGLKNSFMSISTNTINAVRGFVRNAWSNASRFLSLDIRQQLSNVMGLITGSITRVIGGAISLAVKGIKLAIGAVVGVIRTGLKIVTGAVLGALKLAWQGVSWAISKVWSLVSGLASMVFRFVYQSLLKIGSFILGFMWTTIKWVAGAIAGFLWDTVKSIAATVGKTFLYLTTQLVGTIVISIMAALGPYIALIGGIFLLVMYFTGQLNEWWNGLLGWFGMGSNKESPAQNADTSKGFWATLYGWVWGNENEQGWLKEGLSTLGDLLVQAFGLGQNLMDVVGRGWGVVEDWGNRFVITPLTEFLQSTTFGRWIERTFNFLKEWFMETAMPWLRREILGETEENVRGDILSAQERLLQISNQLGGGELATAREELARREAILANGIGNQAKNQEMVTEAEERIQSLEAERDQLRSDLISSKVKLDTNNFDQGLLSRIAEKLSSWWFGENGNWETPISGSPMAGILNMFFGSASLDFSSETGIWGETKSFLNFHVVRPILDFIRDTVVTSARQILQWLGRLADHLEFRDIAQGLFGASRSLDSFQRGISGQTKAIEISRARTLARREAAGQELTPDQGEFLENIRASSSGSSFLTDGSLSQNLSNSEIVDQFKNRESEDMATFNSRLHWLNFLIRSTMAAEWIFDPAFHNVGDNVTKKANIIGDFWDSRYDLTGNGAWENDRWDDYFRNYWYDGNFKLPYFARMFAAHTTEDTQNGYNFAQNIRENLLTEPMLSIFLPEEISKIRTMINSVEGAAEYVTNFRNTYISENENSDFNEWFSELTEVGMGRSSLAWLDDQLRRDAILGYARRLTSDNDYNMSAFGIATGGVALPDSGGINAWIAEAGDPEMVIPLNSQGADFIIETMNRVNIGNSNSNLNEKLDSIDRKISGLTPSEARESPSTSLVEEYNPPVELPQDRKKFDFVKYMAMGMFEGNS